MDYYFEQLSPDRFQRLINTILVARFGEDARLTPLYGSDGGRDGETAAANPYFEFQIEKVSRSTVGLIEPPRQGRYLFQAKHHKPADKRLTDVRQTVVSEFENELKKNVLNREGPDRVNYFFLITNISSSVNALSKIERIQITHIRQTNNLYADVWWKEHLTALLDQMPSIWASFPEIFPGGQLPYLARVVNESSSGLTRAIRLAIKKNFERESSVKFRQIELDKDLSRLFVDLDAKIHLSPRDFAQRDLVPNIPMFEHEYIDDQDTLLDRILVDQHQMMPIYRRHRRKREIESVLSILLNEIDLSISRKILLEGGPGQGKSTITQMTAQIYREQALQISVMDTEGRWVPPRKVRIPFRIELRKFAEWLANNKDASVEQFLSLTIKNDSGGNEISVGDIQGLASNSPLLLIFDGLDEVGSDNLRNEVISVINECIKRLEDDLKADLRVVVTTRPPAITGKREMLADFRQVTIAPMDRERVDEYVKRWLSVQVREKDEQDRVQESFNRRKNETHVQALARNPMQLSVLLQFIELKGEAFPDRRAELYRDYFKIVIDRDVEKSRDLRKHRDVIEALHEFLGYKIHSLTEIDQADRTIERKRLLQMVEDWLSHRGGAEPGMAEKFFKLGEERFGLIVAPKGEGEETRYGFEIQPIQEYFSAAFISNQIPPDSTHDVFEAMLRRPYWREVALFLAGLRRPNEKADLIARARKLDDDADLGWLQDGRATILQLLQEGVFSDPPYVFSQALDFEIELLDPEVISIQQQPPRFLETLGNLLEKEGTAQQERKIRRLLRKYVSHSEEYVIYRLFAVASKIIQEDDLKKTILSYKNCSYQTIAKLRLSWPYSWHIKLHEADLPLNFWNESTEFNWVYEWWRTGLRFPESQNITAPSQLHSYLVEQFAFTALALPSLRNFKQLMSSTIPNWAIWRTVRYQQILYLLLKQNKRTENFVKETRSDVFPQLNTEIVIDYSGLEHSVEKFLRELLDKSRELILSFYVDDKKIDDSLINYILMLRVQMEKPGIISWLSCRAAVILLFSLFDDEFIEYGIIPRINPASFFEDKSDFLPLIQSLQQFFPKLDDSYSQRFEFELEGLSYFMHHVTSRSFLRRRMLIEATPTNIRLAQGEDPIPVNKLLRKYICDRTELPYKWLEYMPYNTSIIRPLVEDCRDCLQVLLAILSKLNFVDSQEGHSLRVQDTQRILKIARQTNEQDILTGALIVISDSKFLRLAKTKLILKLIASASNNDLFATKLFRNRRFMENYQSDEIEKLRDVAGNIIAFPEAYTFRIVCAAAEFMAEHNQIDFSPLVLEEANLNITN